MSHQDSPAFLVIQKIVKFSHRHTPMYFMFSELFLGTFYSFEFWFISSQIYSTRCCCAHLRQLAEILRDLARGKNPVVEWLEPLSAVLRGYIRRAWTNTFHTLPFDRDSICCWQFFKKNVHPFTKKREIEKSQNLRFESNLVFSLVFL